MSERPDEVTGASRRATEASCGSAALQRTHEPVRGYAIAVAATLAALSLAQWLSPFVESVLSPPSLLAVLVASIYGGRGPGVLATVLNATARAVLEVRASEELSFGLDDVLRLLTFLVVALIVSWLAAARRSAEEEARSALAELAAVDRAKDEFIASVSHELRTPLTSISGWLQLLQARNLDEQSRAVALQSMNESVQTQTLLVNDLLDASRLILGKLVIDREPLDLRAAVTAAADVIRPSAHAGGVAVTVHVPEHPVVALIDAERMKQVVWNLLSNAMRFVNSGGEVHLILSPFADGTAVIEVRDSGQGIDPAVLPHLFERFQQGPDGARRGGLGLGLSIVKYIVEQHDGSVAAANSPAGGAVFTVSIPLAVTASHDGPGAAASPTDATVTVHEHVQTGLGR